MAKTILRGLERQIIPLLNTVGSPEYESYITISKFDFRGPKSANLGQNMIKIGTKRPKSYQVA
jgi:hypothetical protein